jgi:lipoate-protein ligase B/very-short-patch-repair endonuclease
VIIRSLGRVDYQTTWDQMRTFTDARAPETEDELWVCEHPPVFTQGVAGKPEHLLFNPTHIPVIKTDRGGQITYHGPGQAMVYVLLNLKRAGYGVREMVMRIENAVIALLAAYGVEAYGKRDAPGVYVLFPSPASGRGVRGEGGDNPTNLLPKTRTIPPQLLTNARALRQTTTDAETLMWFLLRNRALASAKFRRQHATRDNDPRYILDFYCAEHRLGIELDGGQHVEQSAYDAKRDAWFAEQGIHVLRFWNNDVLSQTEAVLEVVYAALTANSPPSPLTPLPLAGEGNRTAQHSNAQLDATNEVQSSEPLSRMRERGRGEGGGGTEAKIAALGLKVRNGHTYHGLAFNVNMDLTPFFAINPCGYEGLRVTHLHELGVDLSLEAAGMSLAEELRRQLTAPAK